MKWTNERVEKIMQTTSEICGSISNGQTYELYYFSKKGILQKIYLKFEWLNIFNNFEMPISYKSVNKYIVTQYNCSRMCIEIFKGLI